MSGYINIEEQGDEYKYQGGKDREEREEERGARRGARRDAHS